MYTIGTRTAIHSTCVRIHKCMYIEIVTLVITCRFNQRELSYWTNFQNFSRQLWIIELIDI